MGSGLILMVAVMGAVLVTLSCVSGYDMAQLRLQDKQAYEERQAARQVRDPLDRVVGFKKRYDMHNTFPDRLIAAILAQKEREYSNNLEYLTEDQIEDIILAVGDTGDAWHLNNFCNQIWNDNHARGTFCRTVIKSPRFVPPAAATKQ